MIMCVLLCYPVSIRIYYQQGGRFLVFLAPYRPSLRDRGTVNGTQTGISGTILYILIQNLRKNDIPSSLSCNPATGRLNSALSPTW